MNKIQHAQKVCKTCFFKRNQCTIHMRPVRNQQETCEFWRIREDFSLTHSFVYLAIATALFVLIKVFA